MSIKRFLEKPEKVFLLIGIIFGIFYLVVTPPARAPDEATHFGRNMEFSRGSLASGKTRYASSVIDLYSQLHHRQNLLWSEKTENYKYTFSELLSLFEIPLDKETEREVETHKVSMVNLPVPYMIAPFVLYVAYELGIPPAGLLYVARLSILITSLAILYYAIKILPVMKWPVCFVALLPMMTFLRSAVSADSGTFAFTVLYIVLVFKLALESEHISRWNITVLFITATVLALCKSLYVLLPFIVLIIPVHTFGSWKRYIVTTCMVTFPGVITSVLWSSVVKRRFFSEEHFLPAESVVSPDSQIQYIVDSPGAFINVLMNTFFSESFITHTNMTFIGFLGHIDRQLPMAIYKLCTFSLFFLIVFASRSVLEEKIMKNKTAALSFIIFVGTTLLILTALYVQWTPYKSTIVMGFQGRYLYPQCIVLLFASLLVLPRKRPVLPEYMSGIFVIIVSTISLWSGLFAILGGDFK